MDLPALSERDGSTPQKAVIVSSIAEEHRWLQNRCPGFSLTMQALREIDGKPYDLLRLQSPQGDQRDVYFDISAFFGKKRRQGGPPCPYCGVPLRSERAKQCL